MHDLVVVGAGPYGLSVAAHAAAAGWDVRVLGRTMASWRDHMPEGMFLKSEPWASNLSDPAGSHTLAAYCATRGLPAEHGNPLPIGVFTDYGRWFGERVGPAVEEKTVSALAPQAGGYRLETADGETLLSRTVVLAVGVMPFVRLPEALTGLPAELATHSSDHRDLSRFRDRDVTVVGAGQAALETAALLAEQGARTRVVARAAHVNWNTVPQPLERSPWRSLRDPHCGLGTGWPSWVWSQTPWAVRRLPAAARLRITDTALGPAGAWWLRDRFESRVPVLLGHQLLAAEPAGEGLRLSLTGPGGDTTTVDTDHVVAATGFIPDVDRLTLLDPALRDTLRTVGDSRAPDLGARFESSSPGLFFAGLLTAPTFGPSMRFVYGATFTAARLAEGVRRRLGTRRLTAVPAPAAGANGTPAARGSGTSGGAARDGR
ncbi:NAD(P)-binding domain-containing protein [Streptomyces sp. 549]|uniref:NAD(P)-binding domain-containing protein n=1 Tax=Streptomyces sp. 549 TaxID=3049076 RepID=UPI0024C26151|nr:NAD(P)-binding domain-containing protein [Streptomyces sp. 549]MDK1473565.1 NAD(P)-binding domain-containing protein [Streptomyces sp. 549]